MATWAMILLCVCGVVVAAAGFLGPRRAAGPFGRYGARGSELFHAVMLAAMAAMWSALGEVLPVVDWRLLFAALAIASLLWPILGATRGRPGDRADRIGAAVYHCVGALAMVYATLGSVNSPSEHTHHTAVAHSADLPYPVVGWFLAGLFVLDAVVVVVAVIRPPGEAVPTRHAFVVTVFPHLAMDIAMTAMLVAALTAPGPDGSAAAMTAGL